jgi:hypothetical protein
VALEMLKAAEWEMEARSAVKQTRWRPVSLQKR